MYPDEPDCIRLRSHGSARDAYLITSAGRPLTARSTLLRRLALTTLTD